MSSRVAHTDVGAYSLGLLDNDDRVAFESHLSSCWRCQSELGELSGMRGLFEGIDPEVFTPLHEPPFRATAPPPPPAADLGAARRARDGRRRRATRVLTAVAASAALVVAGVAVGGGFASSDSGPPVAGPGPDHGTGAAAQVMLTGERHPAEGTVQGVGTVNAAVAVEEKGWGSHIGLELRGVQGPLLCDLVAVGKDGSREVIGSWTVPPKGYGVPGNPEPLIFHGGSSIPKDALDRLEVDVVGGQQLVTIPV